MRVSKPDELLRLKALEPGVHLYLLAGPDEATVERTAAHLIGLAGSDAERVDLASTAFREDPSALDTAATSPSLFAGKRIVRLSIAAGGDDALEAVAALLERDDIYAPVVALAPAMTTRAKLLSLADGSRHARAAVCYQPKRHELVAAAIDTAASLALKLGNAQAQTLVDLVDGDQLLVARELEKIALYLDADATRPRQVTDDALRALGAASHDEDIGTFVNVVLSGKAAQIGPQLAQMRYLGVAEIRLIRSLSMRVQMLARLRPQLDRGQSPQAVTENRANGVFFKDKDAVAQQLRIWNAPRIARVNQRLIDCEVALKTPGTPGDVLFRQLVASLAAEANRAR